MGGAIMLTHDPIEAVFGAEAVHTDVWTSMGTEPEEAARKNAFARFAVDTSLMRHASSMAIFMHCLPAHRGQEVTAAVIDGPASRVWAQAANRMHTETALLYWLLTGDASGRREP
jgi:ornithine carbamoyltransferase